MLTGFEWQFSSLRRGWANPAVGLVLKKSSSVEGAFERIGISLGIEETFFGQSWEDKITLI